MSYDHFYIDNGTKIVRIDPRGSDADRNEYDRMHQSGHAVALFHGANVLIDELFLFSTPESAKEFYEAGFHAFEYSDEKGSPGFDRVHLFKGFSPVAEKHVPSTGIFIADEAEANLTPPRSDAGSFDNELDTLPISSTTSDGAEEVTLTLPPE